MYVYCKIGYVDKQTDNTHTHTAGVSFQKINQTYCVQNKGKGCLYHDVWQTYINQMRCMNITEVYSVCCVE